MWCRDKETEGRCPLQSSVCAQSSGVSRAGLAGEGQPVRGSVSSPQTQESFFCRHSFPFKRCKIVFVFTPQSSGVKIVECPCLVGQELSFSQKHPNALL